jgi:aryl-alcohol dehydrogenase-like predicted oxidoreductase
MVGAVGLGGMYLSIASTPPSGTSSNPWRPDEADAIAVVVAALDAGMTLIDTADVYCFDDHDIGHNERLIAKAVASWAGDRSRVVIATKGGLRRPGGAWTTDARPERLRSACEASLRALGTDVIDVYQLHAPDAEVRFEDSVGELARLREEGKIRRVGLSNVDIREIEKARAIVPIASVQNRWNPDARQAETHGVLAHCTLQKIAFLPYSPFGGARGAANLGSRGGLASLAAEFGVTPHRLILAWMLAKSPVVIPIPGGRRKESAEDSAKAPELELSPGDMAKIEASW